MKKRATLLPPPSWGGSGWGLFSPPHNGAKRNRLAPTLTLPRLGGGNCSEHFERHMRLLCPTWGEGSAWRQHGNKKGSRQGCPVCVIYPIRRYAGTVSPSASSAFAWTGPESWPL